MFLSISSGENDMDIAIFHGYFGSCVHIETYLVECQLIPLTDTPSIAQLMLDQQLINITVDSRSSVN